MQSRRFLVGLTGGIGSGKSTVADLFAAHGANIVDTDAVAHALTAAGGAAIPEIRRAFGDSVIEPEGALDRAEMRKLVFADPAARQRLEAILHPMIGHCCELMIAEASGPYTIVVVPLLVESSRWRERIDRLLVVDVPVEVQIERVMKRNRFERSQVEAIMAAQATREARLAAADDVVDNSGDPASLEEPVEALHRQYLALASAAAAVTAASAAAVPASEKD
ncbi:MAG TPA: dephospho-CoA kinase [Burkholderiaceae bacterium]|nr:dephospho-CoA kinase [Burkholderiaceae bacterium]